MDWNLGPCSKATSKLMVNTSNGSTSLNPMAAVFYARPGMSGLDMDHSGSPTMRDGLLYGFEGSDQESVDVEVNEQDPLHHVEKKRRLTVEQVRSLELNFEIENKLEPERKKQLAHELGLQPRQVAVWFQNRRARWKTKQLERDYDTLKASYDNLVLENKRLQSEVMNLTNKSPISMENKLEVPNNNSTIVAGNNKQAIFDMEVDRVNVTTGPPSKRKKSVKEGSPCSDGYTSEILDADYTASEAVPIVEEIVTFEPQSCSSGGAAGPSDPASASTFFQQTVTKAFKEEPDGIVYDPHSINDNGNNNNNNNNSSQFVMIPFKFEDGLLFNEPDDGNPPYCFLADDHSITPWWT